MRRFIALLLLLCLCGSAFKASAAVLITQDETYADVVDGSSQNIDDENNTGSTIAVATLPGYSSTTASLFTTAGIPASLSGSFAHERLGVLNSYSRSYVSANFSTDVNEPYTASGSYSNSAGFTELYTALYDNNTGTYVFENDQTISGGPATLTVGGTVGNNFLYLIGTPTGTLLAGHDYQWNVEAITAALDAPDLGALASGSVSLTIGAAAVPESSSAIVWSLLGLSMGGAGWWRRARWAA